MTTYPLEIWTIASMVENGYTASCWCARCRCWLASPDLPALVPRYGGKPLRDLGLRCPRCQCAVGLTIHPPRKPGGDMRWENAVNPSIDAPLVPGASMAGSLPPGQA